LKSQQLCPVFLGERRDFMHVRYYKEYSQHLQRDMEFKVYGHAGLPMIVYAIELRVFVG
jgi:hypothetical protein